MADKTFDLDGDDAAFEARKKALAEQRDKHRAEAKSKIGELAVLTGLPNGRTAANLVGSFLWCLEQSRANPKLDKEWTQLGTTFLGKSAGAKKTTAGRPTAAATKPPSKVEPDRSADARPDDLLTRTAAE